MSKVYVSIILILVANFLIMVVGVALVTNYLFPLFGIGITFSWKLVLGVFGVTILLRNIFSGSIRFKS